MAGELLNTEQVLLLENLMYLTNQDPLKEITAYEGTSIAQLINSIDMKAISTNNEYGTFVTGQEWRNMLQAIKNDDMLMNMQIMTTHVDHAEGGGGGVSALFANPDTGEAVVAFRGTAGNEWKDNFIGGAATNTADGVSTQQQLNALEWYQSLNLDQYSTVMVTGHSKGGNKAKYITIMDESVDRCISFDGQGFSDEFIERYEGLIAQRQKKINNHNAEYDYVNLLLNDVGNTTFYQGNDFGAGGFIENHCPNTLFEFKEDGTYQMIPVNGQSEEMQILDEFLNSYLRSVDGAGKQEAMETIGMLAEMLFNGASMNDILSALSEGSYVDQLSYLLAYFIRYEQENPAFADAIRSILVEFDMAEFLKIVDIADGIMNWKHFDMIMDALSYADDLPDWLLEQLAKYLSNKFGITLSTAQLRQLLSVFEKTNYEMDAIEIVADGKDRVVSASGFASFSIKMDSIRDAGDNIRMISGQINRCKEELDGIAADLKGTQGMVLVKIRLKRLAETLSEEARAVLTMGNELDKIMQVYSDTENTIVNNALGYFPLKGHQ